jgi:NAD(P)-dependent dehydrogenase (short-subunit alcohol dehydrogenase family)
MSYSIETGKRIFITGGASGLGRALAQRYARAGWRVCIGDRDAAGAAETIAALTGPQAKLAHALSCDVTRESDLEAAAAWLRASWGGVDVVVNNAGVAQVGGIVDTTLDDWQWIIDINLLGVVRGCKVFTPLFRAQGGGHFVNVASMAGLVHPPLGGAYNASKAAVVALSETLAFELHADAIAVSVVCPAFFRTRLAEHARAADSASALAVRKLVGKARHGADEIAALVERGIARRDFHILTHREVKVVWLMKRFLPFALYAAGLRREIRRAEVKRQAKLKRGQVA